jgi:DNA-binding PucR family transcriptional regulator
VTSYRSVALEALALADEGRARAFVAQELGSLVRDSPEARRLRTTLCSYFASEQNAATAAIELGVHERTVRHRLRKVETVLGVSPAARRAELEAALRFAAVLRCPFVSDSPVDPE